MNIWLLISEDDAVDLCSGYVPLTVKAKCLQLLDYRREDERRAARPYVHGKAASASKSARTSKKANETLVHD